MKAIVKFIRIYEVEITGNEETDEEILNQARNEFESEFEFLDGSIDNFSSEVIIPPKLK